MSWFDTKGLANIAKSALKEAQRTIDKALDIKDETDCAAPVNTPVDTNSDDFFSSWGVSTERKELKKQMSEETGSKNVKGKMPSSLWGSFTGSFFDTANATEAGKSGGSVESLDDSVDSSNEHFSGSKLVVQPSEELEIRGADCVLSAKKENTWEGSGVQLDSDETIPPRIPQETEHRKEDSNKSANRLSVISCDSVKNSSESVEVLTGTGCTTTPDSDSSMAQLTSNTNSKPNSESVEIIQDSLTSPSSIEVIESDKNKSRRQSQYTDEFVSPLQSPLSDGYFQEKTSPDSVEVIVDDQEDNSIGEDTMSYMSISKSTANTILEVPNQVKTQKHLKDAFAKADAISEISQEDSKDQTITRAPGRTMQLPFPNQLIDTQPQSSKLDMSGLLNNYNVIDIPQDNESLKSESSETMLESNDESSQSDKTLVATDNFMESSSDDTSTTTDSNSVYLKHMLADAMTEKHSEPTELSSQLEIVKKIVDQDSFCSVQLENDNMQQSETVFRDTSPLSSESRSDLVKIGSDHTSGHTSGDELETTTSSDIEIISSPNGDSSSSHSRMSPAMLSALKSKCDPNVDSLLEKMTFKRIKGHNRELSGASSISDDSEIDRLIKRINEMTEILESREAKLIDVSRRCAELQESNEDMKRQLDAVFNKQVESAEVSQVTEEFTQRLSALERKFQQAIREKDSLRKQLDTVRQEAAAKLSKGEFETLLNEKEETIKELRQEGEKLSKQQLQHSNIIKKLRAKEKENEQIIKNMKDKLEDTTLEADRLKKCLVAKEEVERTQIEAVHQLTAKNKKLETEQSQLQSQLEDLTQKQDVVKKSLDAAKKELADKTKATSELHSREQTIQQLEQEKQIAQAQSEEALGMLEDLRRKLCEIDSEYLGKMQDYRLENSSLLRRLEEAEARNEELSQSVVDISKPLVLQIESLQAMCNKKSSSFEKIEENLMQRISELQMKVQSLQTSEKNSKEECQLLKSSLSNLEGQFRTTSHELNLAKVQIEQQKAEEMILRQELTKNVDHLEHELKVARQELEVLTKDNESLRAMYEIEKKKSQSTQEELGLKMEAERQSRNVSPSFSVGRSSLPESLTSSQWPADDSYEASMYPTRCTNILEVQLMQTNLKQREGEVQQLQWELNRREHERKLLNNEISELMSKIEKLESKMSNYEALTLQFVETQQQYETLCQLYGEKVEENEELRLDLQDVKEVYKQQIDTLLQQQKENAK